MKRKRNKPNSRTRADVHSQFRLRAIDVFQFLVLEYGFHVGVQDAATEARARDASVRFIKNNSIIINIDCSGIFQSLSLQIMLECGWIVRGLHRAMASRCPDVVIPPTPQTEDETALRQILECYADALRCYFQDFLDGSVSEVEFKSWR